MRRPVNRHEVTDVDLLHVVLDRDRRAGLNHGTNSTSRAEEESMDLLYLGGSYLDRWTSQSSL